MVNFINLRMLGMSALMVSHVSKRVERFFAILALVWSMVDMNPLMNFQIRPLTKNLAAVLKIAFIWLSTIMQM
jgi:hypothetical protein